MAFSLDLLSKISLLVSEARHRHRRRFSRKVHVRASSKTTKKANGGERTSAEAKGALSGPYRCRLREIRKTPNESFLLMQWENFL